MACKAWPASSWSVPCLAATGGEKVPPQVAERFQFSADRFMTFVGTVACRKRSACRTAICFPFGRRRAAAKRTGSDSASCARRHRRYRQRWPAKIRLQVAARKHVILTRDREVMNFIVLGEVSFGDFRAFRGHVGDESSDFFLNLQCFRPHAVLLIAVRHVSSAACANSNQVRSSDRAFSMTPTPAFA